MRLWAAALPALCGCGLLMGPEAGAASAAEELEAAAPALDLGGLKLSRLRVEPPRLAPGDSATVPVHASLWAEGTLGGARFLFHGPEELELRRGGLFGRWRFGPDLPRMRGIAAALLRRRPPAQVTAWAVGVQDARGAEIREEYAKDASGRPVLAARRLLARRSDGPWSLLEP